MGQKLGDGCALFSVASWVPIQDKVAWAEAYLHGSIQSGILVHPAVWPQQTLTENRGPCPFRGGAAGSPSNTMSCRGGLPPYQVAS